LVEEQDAEVAEGLRAVVWWLFTIEGVVPVEVLGGSVTG
jgi:hypothetical protein